MRPHEERVIREKTHLDENIQKLVDFMYTKTFAELPAVEQGLLMVQVRAMDSYSRALGDRIERF